MSPPEARSRCYLTPLSHRKIDTHPLWSVSTTKSDTLPFSFVRDHSSCPPPHQTTFESSRVDLISWVNSFSQTHKNAMVFKSCSMMGNEWGLVEVDELLGASQVQVCFSDWEAVSCSFHTSTFGTFHTIWMGENKYKTWNRSQDGQKLGPAERRPFSWRKWALPLEADPPCSFVTQVTWTLLADSCQGSYGGSSVGDGILTVRTLTRPDCKRHHPITI